MTTVPMLFFCPNEVAEGGLFEDERVSVVLFRVERLDYILRGIKDSRS